MRLSEKSWAAECAPLAEAVNGAAAEGWTLVSLALPSNDWAVLTLSRPKATEPKTDLDLPAVVGAP